MKLNKTELAIVLLSDAGYVLRYHKLYGAKRGSYELVWRKGGWGRLDVSYATVMKMREKKLLKKGKKQFHYETLIPTKAALLFAREALSFGRRET